MEDCPRRRLSSSEATHLCTSSSPTSASVKGVHTGAASLSIKAALTPSLKLGPAGNDGQIELHYEHAEASRVKGDCCDRENINSHCWYTYHQPDMQCIIIRYSNSRHCLRSRFRDCSACCSKAKVIFRLVGDCLFS